ncbi:MAG: hypothetical protein JWP75_1805 [Frondihabitans sp.]|nr:hypothetical protein [Frondihabitans sp.]
MSSFKHPVGSQPASVYWRRRAVLVFAVLLLVLVVIVLIAVKPGAGSSASPVATPTTSAPAAVAAPSRTSATTPKATSTPAATAAANGACTASQINLKPITDKSSYTSLQQPQISMSITNTSTTACTIDLGSSQQVLTITSGAETYWTSKDCQVHGTHQNVKLTAGQTLTTPAIAWDRTRSSTSTCNATRSSVPAGGASYHLSVSVGLIKSSTTALMVLN